VIRFDPERVDTRPRVVRTMGTLEHTKVGTAIRANDMVQEAILLAADGELGNTDAAAGLYTPDNRAEQRRRLVA